MTHALFVQAPNRYSTAAPLLSGLAVQQVVPFRFVISFCNTFRITQRGATCNDAPGWFRLFLYAPERFWALLNVPGRPWMPLECSCLWSALRLRCSKCSSYRFWSASTSADSTWGTRVRFKLPMIEFDIPLLDFQHKGIHLIRNFNTCIIYFIT